MNSATEQNRINMPEGLRLAIRDQYLLYSELNKGTTNPPTDSKLYFQFRTYLNQMPETDATMSRSNEWWLNAFQTATAHINASSQSSKCGNEIPTLANLPDSIYETGLIEKIQSEIRDKVNELDPEGFGLKKALNNTGTAEQRTALNNLILEHYSVTEQAAKLADQLTNPHLNLTEKVIMGDAYEAINNDQTCTYLRGLIAIQVEQFCKLKSIQKEVGNLTGSEKILDLAQLTARAFCHSIAMVIYPEDKEIHKNT